MSTPAPEYVEALRKRGFQIAEYLGGGAYGSVYKAAQVSLHRAVAIKFFDKPGTQDAANRARFEREAPLLARVQHPAVPYVITTGTVSRGLRAEVPYTVMQYVSGPRLDHRIDSGKLPVSLIPRVMRDVLSALECAHQLGVVHRDVKPDNIVLSEQGTYLLDFSIGFCVEVAAGLPRATGTGDRIGNYLYAAPEQMEDASKVTARADVYSAGVVLAEMLGARPRLRADALDAALPDVSQALKDVIRRATADDPEGRYESAGSFREALDRVMGPTGTDFLEKRLVLCPNTTCGSARWSNGEKGTYFWGPKVTGPTAERHCEACGTEYVRGCPKCRRPLPTNVEQLVAKATKTQRDAVEAFCSACGDLLFRTPTCEKCGSYLSKPDMKKDTSANGCAKCRRKAEAATRTYGGGGYGGGYGTPAPVPTPDDDIPF